MRKVLTILLVSTLGVGFITPVMAGNSITPIEIERDKLEKLEARMEESERKLVEINKLLEETTEQKKAVEALLSKLGISGEDLRKLGITMKTVERLNLQLNDVEDNVRNFNSQVVNLRNAINVSEYRTINATKETVSNINQHLDRLEQENRALKLRLSLSDGLMAYYPFNINADDESGNGRHGENYGATLITGKFGNAYSFDGEKSRIKLSPSSIQNSELTVNFWINTSGINKDGAGIISGARDNKMNNEYLIFLDKNGKLAPHYHNDVKATSVVVNDGIWHMLTVNTEINQTKVYVDSSLKETIAFGSTTPFKLEGLWLGGDQDTVNGGWETTQQFTGIIDELRIYNRILSDSEITNLYKLSQ